MTTLFDLLSPSFERITMEHKQEFGHKEPRIGGDFESTTEEDVSFFHDFVAGGIAGSASVVVGHPFDTIKVCAF